MYSKEEKNHREPSKTHIESLVEFILEKRHDKYIKQFGLDNTFESSMDYFNLMQKIHQLKDRQDQRIYFEKRGISSKNATLEDIPEMIICNQNIYSKEEIKAIINNCTIDEFTDFISQDISELRISCTAFLQSMQNICFLCYNFDTLFKFSNELILIFDTLLRHDLHSLQKLDENRQAQFSSLSKSRKIHSETIMYSRLLGIEFIYDYEVDAFSTDLCLNQMLSKEIDNYFVNLIFYINLLHDKHWNITKLFLQEKAKDFSNANNANKKKIIEKFISNMD